MKTTAVIMAGGKGERFWPKSRNSMPKQFLSLTGDGVTMLQKTVERISSVVQIDDVFVVTNENYADIVKEQLPEIPAENILSEPCGRNTAPCIALAAAIIGRKYDDAIMLVLPSDHVIGDVEAYVSTLKTAISAASEGYNLVTVGITPTYPETGYGYIKYKTDGTSSVIFGVDRFVEKPDLKTAEEYLKSGNYLWNSGMFIWKISSVNFNIKKHMPDTYSGAEKIGEAFGTADFPEVLRREFNAFKSESIDFGIMEKADSIYTVPGSFGWDDAGSWLAVGRINSLDGNGNYFDGDVLAVDTFNTTVCGGERLIAAVGIDNAIIVDTDDVLLICSKNKTQDVKEVIRLLKEKNRVEFL